mgnify:CR=1 FL=1
MKLDPVKVESGYVNREELASILGFSSRHISNLMKQGIIPYIKIGPRAIRYDLEQLNKYIEHNTVRNISEKEVE